jgi:ATP-dependent DNA helicase RecQ
MSVEGIGQNQYSLFGPELLSLLQAFYVTQKHKKNLKGKSYLETLKMYNEGLTPEQISAAKGVHLYTIYTHYGHLFQQGEKIELSHYITNDEILEIEKAIQKIEDASENRLRAYFKEKFPFYKVKMGIAIIESVKKKSQDPD